MKIFSVNFNKSINDKYGSTAVLGSSATVRKDEKGYALKCNSAATDYITYGDLASINAIGTGEFSVVVGANTKGFLNHGSTNNSLIGKTDTNTVNGFVFYYAADNAITFRTGATIISAVLNHRNKNNLFIATRNSAGLCTFYVNGVSYGTPLTSTTNVSSTAPMTIGYDGQATTRTPNASIYLSEVYNHCLSEVEIQKLTADFLASSAPSKPKIGFIQNKANDLSSQKLSYQSITTTPLTVKGGVVRVIDSSTGDIARTTSGWMEDNEALGVYAVVDAGTGSAEIDNDVLYEGHKTLKLTTTNATGRMRAILGYNSGTAASLLPALLSKYAYVVKPSTAYRLSVPVNFTNLLSNNAFTVQEFSISGSRLATMFSTLESGNSSGWLTRTVNFTTNVSTVWVVIVPSIVTAGDGQSENYAIMSAKLEEVSTITNSTSSPALLYPTFTAVSSNNNIDQSQVTAAGTHRAFGDDASRKYYSQQFLPTKKNLSGIVFQKNTDGASGTFAGDVVVSIYSNNSNNPATLLATKTVSNATILSATNLTDINVLFDNILNLTVDGSTTYHIVWMSTTVDASNFLRLVYNSGGGYASGVPRNSADGITWVNSSVLNTVDFYFKTLYSKNTTNFTVSTDTETLSVTAPTVDGWADGTIIDTAGLSVTPLTLAPGVNNVYYSSNGADTADGTVDASLQAIIGGTLKGVYPSLIASYNMIKNGTTLVDTSGNNNGMTLTGGNTNSTKEGINFPNSGYYKKTSFTGLSTGLNANAYTVSMRVKVNEAVRVQVLLSFLGPISKYLDTSNKLVISGTSNTLTSNQALDLNKWYTINLLVKAPGAEIYIDGVSDNSNSNYTENITGANALIAYSSAEAGATKFNGELADVRIHNRVLTAQECRDYHNSFIVPIISEDFSTEPADGTTNQLPQGWIGTSVVKFAEVTTPDAVLPTITKGTKYVEGVTLGSLRLGATNNTETFEFDFYKGASGVTTSIFFMRNVTGSYLFQFNTANQLVLLKFTGVTATTICASVTNYVTVNTWYRFKITRTNAGVFAVYLKGGTFGKEWVLMSTVGGAGTNPATDLTYNIFTDLAITFLPGDRITNILALNGVEV